MVHVKELRVRPRKQNLAGMCTLQLTSMLGCWSASKDIHSIGQCKSAAEALLLCMRSTPAKSKAHRPAINYHLARLGKRM
ncbi:hypothetical protein BDZ89DRAFT_940532 [Hymenopellis radicata]|nr:hypothetical protein BDZ89DRAFT_940532 [Hymenopellis radicata]